QYKAISFKCDHLQRRLIKHCHFARNDPKHKCAGAWRITRGWKYPDEICQTCISREN
ncbi:hypothetical protein BJ546DRAFT_827966, partial [Cryomyces antarcticus]